MDILVFIICGLAFLLSGFILYGSYVNKKKDKGGGIADTYKEPDKEPYSTNWLGWFIYAIGVIAIGYWVFHSYSVNSPVIALAIIIFVLWAIFDAKALIDVKKLGFLMASPEKSEVVRVISKTFKIGFRASFTDYYVSFEFSNGTRKNFPVDVNQCNSVAENETGTLTYKEYKNDLMFIDFKSIK